MGVFILRVIDFLILSVLPSDLAEFSVFVIKLLQSAVGIGVGMDGMAIRIEEIISILKKSFK